MIPDTAIENARKLVRLYVKELIPGDDVSFEDYLVMIVSLTFAAVGTAKSFSEKGTWESEYMELVKSVIEFLNEHDPVADQDNEERSN